MLRATGAGLVGGAVAGVVEAIIRLSREPVGDVVALVWAPVASGLIGAVAGLCLALPLAAALRSDDALRRATGWLLVATGTGLGLLVAAFGAPTGGMRLVASALWGLGLWLGRAFLARTRLRALTTPAGALGAWALIVGLAAVFALSPSGEAPAASPEEQPADDERTDMLLVVIPGLRPDQLGAGATPAIDALAADGVRFEQAYSNAPGDRAALGSLLFGIEPSGHGLGEPGDGLAEGALSLVELLAESGQVPFAVLADPALARVPGLRRGFPSFDAPLPGPLLGATPSVSTLWLYDRLCRARDGQRGWSADNHRIDASAAAARALAAMRAASARRWFGLVVLADLGDPWLPHRVAPSPAEIEREIGAGLRRVDAAVGQLVAELRARGAYDRSAIVVLSDHGTVLGEDGLWGGETSLVDARVRVPLIVKLPTRRWAGVAAPWRVRLMDVAPTLMRLAGLPAPPRWRGLDLFGDAELDALDHLALGEAWAGDLDRAALIEVSARPEAARALRGRGQLRHELDDARARANAPSPR